MFAVGISVVIVSIIGVIILYIMAKQKRDGIEIMEQNETMILSSSSDIDVKAIESLVEDKMDHETNATGA